jgi:hypothetical protein
MTVRILLASDPVSAECAGVLGGFGSHDMDFYTQYEQGYKLLLFLS